MLESTWWRNRVEVVEDVKEVMRTVSNPLKSKGCEVDDAAAARRSLCSHSVADEVLDGPVGVMHVWASLDGAWASSAARNLPLESIGVVVVLHRKRGRCGCFGLDDEALDRGCGRWTRSRTS